MHLGRKVVHVGEREETQAVVADLHLCWVKVDVLERGVILWHQRQVALNHPSLATGAYNLIVTQLAQTDEARVVHNALELLHGLQESAGRFLVQFLRDDVATAQGGKIALHPVSLLGGLGQVEVARMLQERPLIEMSLKAS